MPWEEKFASDDLIPEVRVWKVIVFWARSDADMNNHKNKRMNIFAGPFICKILYALQT